VGTRGVGGVTLEAAYVAVVGSDEEPGLLRPPVRICMGMREKVMQLGRNHGV
jgi:hypothetical protein